MGTITAQIISDKASLLLLDETHVRWTAPEMIGWINSGMKEIVLQKPNSLTANTLCTLVAGTKQTIFGNTGADVGISLLEVVRNMGAAGAVPGKAITGIDRNILDTINPSWHVTGAAAEVLHYSVDMRDPKTFYVFPGQLAATTQKLEIVISVSPPTILIGAVIPLDDVYESVLIDYVLYRCFSKDSEHTANMQRADYHYKAFMSALGVKTQGEIAFAPSMRYSKEPKPQGAQQ